ARLCPACHLPVASEYHFCPHCGHTIAATCLKCDRRVDPNWDYCPACGTRRERDAEPELSPEPLVLAGRERPHVQEVPPLSPRDGPKSLGDRALDLGPRHS